MTIKKINLARLAHLQPIFIFLLLTAINADPAPGVSTKKLPIEAFLPENVKKAENLPNTPKSQNQGNGVEREADAKFEKEWEKASHLGATSLRDTAQIGLPNGTLGVFDYRLSSRGIWKQGQGWGNRGQFNDYFDKHTGKIQSVFAETLEQDKVIGIHTNNGNYLDQKYTTIYFNVSSRAHTRFDKSTCTIMYNGIAKIEFFENWDFQSSNDTCDLNLTLQAYRKTGSDDPPIPINLTTSDFSGVNVDVTLASKNCGIDLKSTLSGVKTQFLAPMALMLLSIASFVCPVLGMYELWKAGDIYFMNSVSYNSLAIVTILNFQYFGLFMILGLSYSSTYFQYLTVAGICSFLASVVTNKLSYMFFMSQNQYHPLLNEQGFQSPRVRFTSLVLLFELISYIFAFSLVRFPAYSWYVSCFYVYPLVHVFSAVRRGNKNNFRWYYQFYMWCPTILYPFFLRGYEDNFLMLTPVKKPGYFVPIFVLAMVGISYLQSKCGGRFFIPKMLIPGLYKYKVKLSSLTKEELAEPCPICMLDLRIDVDSVNASGTTGDIDSNLEENTLNASFNDQKKSKYAYKTPCGHIFHGSCLKKWMDLKSDCPICRTKLPDYYD